MPETGSVSNWIRSLRAGHDSAAGWLWNRYRQPLNRIADSALNGSARTVADEEDVVVRAFAAFLRRTAEGAWPALQTRDDLWRILVQITRTYAWKQSRHFRRLKRTGPLTDGDTSSILASLADSQPPPDVLAGLSETLKDLLAGLADNELKEVALGRLEGLTVQEIADRQNRSVSTIERRLKIIRDSWSAALQSEGDKS